jgi:hypothetical protein
MPLARGTNHFGAPDPAMARPQLGEEQDAALVTVQALEGVRDGLANMVNWGALRWSAQGKGAVRDAQCGLPHVAIC